MSSESLTANGRPTGGSRPLRVLIIEDSEDDRDLVLLRLRSAGFDATWKQVASADDLRAALTEPWQLILCDYHMPGFGAPEALAIIRGVDPDTPVIIVSGILGEEAAVVAMKAGAQDFFSKNKLTRLGAAVERELVDAETRRARRAAEAERERLLAELRVALAVRDEFLIIASHELRTPLTAMRLQLDSLARAQAQAAARAGAGSGTADARKIGRLDNQLDRVTSMVDRLLDVTKLSSEPLRLVPARLELGAAVSGVVERSRDLLEDVGSTVNLEAVDEVTGWWDPVRLDTVITNVLLNAIKFGPGKPITISVQRVGDAATLTVRDQGIGMTAEERTDLFRRFARAVPKENYGGFGVGLWIVEQLVRAHGGSVALASEKGRGTTVTVVLPIDHLRPHPGEGAVSDHAPTVV
ncbi:MAG TPA: hybrid sensor histidine kinase/response regulator [Polyangia bacterium]|nr:hybrid sensor histidine kinase/response regulator [Polyangia bacterium]